MSWTKNPFKALKVVSKPKALWIDGVRDRGQPAIATVMVKPDAVIAMQDVAGYSGHDPWIDVDVRVAATTEPPFESKAKVTYSTASVGMLDAGTKVNVRYDPSDHDHVVIVDDIQTLLQQRIVTP